MRFSAVFQLPLPLPRAAQEGAAAGLEATAIIPVSAAAPEPSRLPLDLPEDLDARVRLVGEWQLGDG
ncbi:hypothetical protein WG902_21570 [Ramlibacter sp. PS3R-8]|uniref:hypothetical protein n=1 Tax=Ramlibacter sp. PS3R-8 TaxID=3133437 RepID=UPI003098766B